MKKTLLRSFAGRTRHTTPIGETIERVQLLIAIKMQIAIQKSQHPAATKATGGSG